MDAATFGYRLRTLFAELMRPTWNPVMTTAAETPISKVLLPINNYFGFGQLFLPHSSTATMDPLGKSNVNVPFYLQVPPAWWGIHC